MNLAALMGCRCCALTFVLSFSSLLFVNLTAAETEQTASAIVTEATQDESVENAEGIGMDKQTHCNKWDTAGEWLQQWWQTLARETDLQPDASGLDDGIEDTRSSSIREQVERDDALNPVTQNAEQQDDSRQAGGASQQQTAKADADSSDQMACQDQDQACVYVGKPEREQLFEWRKSIDAQLQEMKAALECCAVENGTIDKENQAQDKGGRE